MRQLFEAKFVYHYKSFFENRMVKIAANYKKNTLKIIFYFETGNFFLK